ncbi:UDP-N-acetylglucosamine transferase subunit ALG13 [Bacillus ectoiniformans]|uniref:PssE/Cps14G family polysaccharide biosynthesis glycosyltransferase n=1 Tax=Bacillus ectoiniformans TaxID=1494429 RepID=UPI001956E04E|nr:PssE/Cps14G family polysaccharide biosynthesis glycosyltransferase [Bacillus ectoiniformans]MBM7649337.1 UDP-N-acetylglucosamine transferase subunit ALG13 [Bacillus ectoiniformans]
MIFIVLGTHELPFQRLLKVVEEEIKAGNITSDVMVQSGHTSYESEHMKLIPFMTYHEMEAYYQKADYIITHGGTGSITTAVKMGKKLIAIPRLHKYGEHNDDHQLEIVRQFTESGHILSWNEDGPFSDVIRQISSFHPAPFVSGRKKILSIIEDFIAHEGKRN